jgi:hypothetical protein
LTTAARRLAQAVFADDLPGLPDGIVFDADGNLFVGCYEPSRILRVAPDGGKTEVWANPEYLHLAISGVVAMREARSVQWRRGQAWPDSFVLLSHEVQSATLFRGSFQADVGEDRSTYQLFLVVGTQQTTSGNKLRSIATACKDNFLSEREKLGDTHSVASLAWRQETALWLIGFAQSLSMTSPTVKPLRSIWASAVFS